VGPEEGRRRTSPPLWRGRGWEEEEEEEEEEEGVSSGTYHVWEALSIDYHHHHHHHYYYYYYYYY